MESHSLVESDDVREQGVPQERITVWKRSKAGHLGEMTKIFSRWDEVLKDYCFTSEVTELSCRLKDQWAQYCFVYNEIMSHLPEDVKERVKEIASMIRRERTKDIASWSSSSWPEQNLRVEEQEAERS